MLLGLDGPDSDLQATGSPTYLAKIQPFLQWSSQSLHMHSQLPSPKYFAAYVTMISSPLLMSLVVIIFILDGPSVVSQAFALQS